MVSSAPAIPCRSLCWAKEVSPSRVRQSAWATSFPAELLGALARNRRTAPRRPCALSVCETVLGLRSGGGIDVLLYARPVGTSGMAYGVGMTDKMLTPGLPERREAGVINVEFVDGLSRTYYCRTPRSMSSIPTA
jgi:hypothetical protein